MRDFYMLLNVFRKVTCFAKRNFYKGFEAVAIVGSGIDTCREKYYFRSRVPDASVECRLPFSRRCMYGNQEACGLLG